MRRTVRQILRYSSVDDAFIAGGAIQIETILNLTDNPNLGRNIRNSPEPFLGRLFGVDPQWFMNMQSKYDLRVQAERLADELAAIQPRTAA